MTSNSPERWRPDARFLLKYGAVVFGIGVVVSLLAQFGAGVLRPFDLVLNGFASVLVFLAICGLLTFLQHRIQALSGLRKAAALAGVFFFAGALAWLVTQVLLMTLGLAPTPNWNQTATSIAISCLLAILFGTGFHLYEAMRQQML